MLKSEKVATPPFAGTVAVPPSTAPLGPLPIATVTLPPKPVIVLPSVSCSATTTDGVIAAPAAVVDG